MALDTLHSFISADEVDKIVSQLAQEISSEYKDKVNLENPLLLIVTLKGASIFAADLCRKITIPNRLEFIRAQSYGAATESSGKVNLTLDLKEPLDGQHAILLDEIVDTGFTVQALLKKFGSEKPASLKICSLLSKPSRREVEVPIHYCGREIEDKFVVGYGLDFNEKYRTLSDIFVLE